MRVARDVMRFAETPSLSAAPFETGVEFYDVFTAPIRGTGPAGGPGEAAAGGRRGRRRSAWAIPPARPPSPATVRASNPS